MSATLPHPDRQTPPPHAGSPSPAGNVPLTRGEGCPLPRGAAGAYRQRSPPPRCCLPVARERRTCPLRTLPELPLATEGGRRQRRGLWRMRTRPCRGVRSRVADRAAWGWQLVLRLAAQEVGSECGALSGGAERSHPYAAPLGGGPAPCPGRWEVSKRGPWGGPATLLPKRGLRGKTRAGGRSRG